MKHAFLILMFACGSLSVHAGSSFPLGRTLSDLEQRINGQITEAHRAGNDTVIRLFNELNNLIAIIRANYKTMLNETMDEIDPRLNQTLGSIRQVLVTAENLEGSIREIQDDLLIDSRQLLTDIKFLGLPDQFIQSVSGLAFHHNMVPTIKIQGTHIGPATEKRWVDFSVETPFSDEPFPFYPYMPANNLVMLQLDESIFEFFQSDMLVTLPLKITIRRSVRKSFLGFKWVDANDQVLHLQATLIPEKVGTLRVKAEVPIYDWTDPRIETHGWQGPDCHCSSNCGGHYGRWSESYTRALHGGDVPDPEPGFQRVVSVSGLTCEGAGCSYDTDRSVTITNQGRRVRGKYRCRSRPTYNWFTWTYETYAEVSTKPLNQDFELLKGGLVTLKLPKEARAISIEGQDVYGRNFEIDLSGPEAFVSGSLMVHVSSDRLEENFRIVKLRVSDFSAFAGY